LSGCWASPRRPRRTFFSLFSRRPPRIYSSQKRKAFPPFLYHPPTKRCFLGPRVRLLLKVPFLLTSQSSLKVEGHRYNPYPEVFPPPFQRLGLSLQECLDSYPCRIPPPKKLDVFLLFFRDPLSCKAKRPPFVPPVLAAFARFSSFFFCFFGGVLFFFFFFFGSKDTRRGFCSKRPDDRSKIPPPPRQKIAPMFPHPPTPNS